MTNSPEKDWKDNVVRDTKGVSRKGYVAIALTLGVFSVWAVTFPLASAVVSVGKVISLGQNKLLQHPSGGVVREIIAREGGFLKKGDLVAKIEPASALAELATLTAQRDLQLAKKSRLIAAKSGGTEFNAAQPVAMNVSQLRGTTATNQLASANGNLVFSEQEAEFRAGSQRFQGEVSALANQLATLESEFDGTEQQADRQKSRLQLLDQQYREMKPLVSQGHVAKFRLWDLESNRLQIAAEVAQLEGTLDSLISRMDEVRDQINIARATRNQEGSRELTDVLTELSGIEDRISAAQKLVEYSEIRAPVSGTLTNLTANTIGGVIQGGETIAEIVPSSNPYQIETRLMPSDVGSISIGQEAEVIITAFNRRLEDPIEGGISYIAADSVLDEATGEQYFLARLDIRPEQKVAERLRTGMSAEIYINIESRSFLSYVMRPITDSFRKAFNEQ